MANWYSLGAPSTGIAPNFNNTIVKANVDGRLEVFCVDSSGALWHIWQLTPGGSWSSWSSLGSPIGLSGIIGQVAIGVNKDGSLEVFAIAWVTILGKLDKFLFSIWQLSPGGAWSNWQPLDIAGGHAHPLPTVGVNLDGRIEVFCHSSFDCAPCHIWQFRMLPVGGKKPGVKVIPRPLRSQIGQVSLGGGWSKMNFFHLPLGSSGYVKLDGTGIGVGTNLDGRIEIFLSDTKGALWHIWQTRPGGPWSSWSYLGDLPILYGNLESPEVVVHYDGRLEVFVGYTLDKAVWHKWQVSPGGPWSSWSSLGIPTGISPKSVPHPRVTEDRVDGRLEVFVTGDDGALWHNWEINPGKGGGWNGWSSLGIPSTIGSIDKFNSVGVNLDGRLEVFTRGSDGMLWHTWQQVPTWVWALANSGNLGTNGGLWI